MSADRNSSYQAALGGLGGTAMALAANQTVEPEQPILFSI